MAEAPGNGTFVGGTYPSGAYGYDISTYQCGNFPTGRPPDRHRAGGRELVVNGYHATRASPAGGGVGRRRAQPVHVPDLRHVGDQRTGLQRRHVLQRRLPGRAPRLSAMRPTRRVSTPTSRGGSTSRPPTPTGRATSRRTRSSSRAPSTRCTRPRASPTSASTPARASGTTIVGDYQPDVPYWMADYLADAERPGLVRRHHPLAGEWAPSSRPGRSRSSSTTVSSTTRTTPASPATPA